MKTITIQNGWYRLAGQHLKWPGSVGVAGVGLDVLDLKGETEVTVYVLGKPYRLDVRTAATFCHTNGSFRNVSRTRLAVVPRSMLTPLSPYEALVGPKPFQAQLL